MGNTLRHHGILGMKWGVRNDPGKGGRASAAGTSKTHVAQSISTKAGTITMNLNPPSILLKFASKLSEGIRKNVENSPSYTIKDGDKTIGDLSLIVESPKELNIMWIGINDSHKGRGYGQAVMDSVIEHAKSNNFKKLTLEVPTTSEAARHIYEKVGFKAKGKLGRPDDVWGGLTEMVLNLDNNVKHGYQEDNFMFILKKYLDALVPDEELAHHGILGMKWGVRRTPEQLNGSQGKKDARRVTKLTKSIRIKASYEKRSLEKRIKERMSDADYRREFKKELKHLDNLAEQKRWTKEWNRGIANTVAKTVSTTYGRAMTGQYGRDYVSEMLKDTLRKDSDRRTTNAFIKGVFGS